MDPLPEDPDERKSFEMIRRGVFDGSAMKTVAFGLSNLSRFTPQQGLAKMLAIYANEVSKNAEYTQLLIDTYAKRKMTVPKRHGRK